MMEKKFDFNVKNRDEVIDSLHLRSKEKRVLIALFLILFATVAYENGSAIMQYFFNENFKVPALGERKNYYAKPELIKDLIRKTQSLHACFPQFVNFLDKNIKNLKRAAQLASTGETQDEATKITIAAAKDLWKFTTHPVIQKNDELKELENCLASLQKKLKQKFKSDFEIVPVNFSKIAVEEGNPSLKAKIQRNLFDYENF
ncbi:MAG: hypothetical protein Kow0029_24230 [Candidatus Rifleibacteriota bacterium]